MQNDELRAARAEAESALARYTDLFDFAPVGYLTLDRDGAILSANLTVARLLGVARAGVLRRPLAASIASAQRPIFRAFLGTLFTNGGLWAFCELTLAPAAAPPLVVRLEAVASADGQECRAVVLDINDRHRAEAERDRLIAELQEALAKVKQLSGLLPICASCKKIRDDRGYWNQVDAYVASHSEVRFTHGTCPTCAVKIMQDIADLSSSPTPKPTGQ